MNSLDSLKARFPNYPRWDSVERFLQKVSAFQPLLVLLFGSLAKGDFTQYSDADVLLLVKESVNWAEVYPLGEGVVWPVVWTVGDFEKALQEGNTFLVEALEDGISLAGSETLHRRLLSVLREVKERMGLERVPGGWRWRS